MKKALYGTTALVAAAVVAGQADAASGLKLGITGFYRGAMGGAFGTSNALVPGLTTPGLGTGLYGRENFAFRQEVRVNFTGSTTLDNGITVGVLVGINAGGGNQITSNSTTRTTTYTRDAIGRVLTQSVSGGTGTATPDVTYTDYNENLVYDQYENLDGPPIAVTPAPSGISPAGMPPSLAVPWLRTGSFTIDSF